MEIGAMETLGKLGVRACVLGTKPVYRWPCSVSDDTRTVWTMALSSVDVTGECVILSSPLCSRSDETRKMSATA